MAFQPDIIVAGPDGVTLVVEAKVNLPDLAETEGQLEQYMLLMQCPLGMLVTPTRLLVYRNLYTSPPDFERAVDLDMARHWRQSPPQDPISFEVFVQQWLESLTQQPIEGLAPDVNERLRDYVLPALTEGEVRAAHPRYS